MSSKRGESMTPEQQQEVERLAGDNSPLSDFSRDAIRDLLEDCGRAEGLEEYWRIEHGNVLNLLAAHSGQLKRVRAERDALRAECSEQVRHPDWSKAPEWAQWWAADSNGESYYYEVEPGLCATTWAVASTERFLSAGKIDLPVRNWRMTAQQRP
jgi:hypothetical protein